MQICGLRWLDRKAPIVEWQIGRHEPIRHLNRGDARQPQLLDQPILNWGDLPADLADRNGKGDL